MRILVACEFTAIVRDRFRAAGHDAWSCDLVATEGDPAYHIIGDVREILNQGWDRLICHPPCTYLCSSGLHWNHRVPGRALKTAASLEFVRLLLDAPIPQIALENPIGCISTEIRKYDQIVQPYQYGHDASKATCLWLKNLPLLVPDPAKYVMPRYVVNKAGRRLPRWGNQTDSGQNKLGPTKDKDKRGMDRSRTYEGIADAMVAAWG